MSGRLNKDESAADRSGSVEETEREVAQREGEGSAREVRQGATLTATVLLLLPLSVSANEWRVEQ